MTATAQPKAATDAQALDSYLRMLAGPAPGARLLEIRFALRYRDMGRLFIAAHSAPGASRLIRRLAARTDVYVGVCLRTRRAGGRDAIDRSHLAFVEIDTPDALDRLRAFRHPPSMIVVLGQRRARSRVLHPVRAGHGARARASQPPPRARSRRRPRLSRRRPHPQAAVVLESQALAPRAGRADRTRPGATVRPRPARRRARRPTRPAVRQTRTTPRRTGRTEIDRLLLAIPAAEYVHALTGLSPDRAGKIHCPFHELSGRRVVSDDVSPAPSVADASVSDRGGRR